MYVPGYSYNSGAINILKWVFCVMAFG